MADGITTRNPGGSNTRTDVTVPGGIDPYTGQPYEEQTRRGRGLVGRYRRRRGQRRAERAQKKERQHERDLQWYEEGQDATEEAERLADELGMSVPEVLDLMGGATESELAGARADEGAVGAQTRARDRLEEIYGEGGYTDVERAQIAQALAQSAQAERGQREAVVEQSAARGMRGSGAEIAAQLAAGQGSANRASAEATDIATAGQDRTMRALEGSGSLATTQRGQSFEEDATRRGAADAFAARRGQAAGDRFGMQQGATQLQMGARDAAAERAFRERQFQQQKKKFKADAAIGAVPFASGVATSAIGAGGS
jgi:hypothetical protein